MQKKGFFSGSHNQKFILITIMTLSLLAALFFLVYLGFFSRYTADDFCTAGKLNQLGFWQAQSFWYTQWSGRYAFTFIISLFEQLGAGFSALAPLFGLVLFLLTAYLLVYALLKQTHTKSPRLYALFLSSLLVFLILFSTPALGQALFWMTGMVTYLLPVIFIFRLFSMLLYEKSGYTQNNPVLLFFYYFLILLLAWLSSGFSEIATTMLVTILTLGIFYKRFISVKKSWPAPWITALVGALFGLGMLFFAPGNAVRQASGFTNLGLISLVIITAKSSLTYLLLWLMKNAGLIWSAGLVTLLVGWSFPAESLPKQANVGKKYGFLALSTLIVFVVSFLPTSWALANKPPDRALILPTAVLTLTLVWGCFLAGLSLRKKIKIQPGINKTLFLAGAALVVYFILSGPLYQAYLLWDQQPVYAAYAQAWEERETDIRQQLAAGENQLVVSPLPLNPYGLEELTADPSNWVNICQRDYYGVEAIRIK